MSWILTWCSRGLGGGVVLLGMALAGAQGGPYVRVETVPVAAPHRASELLGARVFLAHNAPAGIIQDLVFTDDGRIDYLAVAFEGQYILVPWDVPRVSYESRSVFIDIPLVRFREIPRFTHDRWPKVHDLQYRERIHKFYGEGPSHEHRGEWREERHGRP
jgi:hypothetical protein